jgi:hypothetical protein
MEAAYNHPGKLARVVSAHLCSRRQHKPVRILAKLPHDLVVIGIPTLTGASPYFVSRDKVAFG